MELDGSGSTDPNNDPLTYEWSQLNGPAVTLEGASTAKPTFKAPAGPATLEFELEVCDPAPLCSTDTVTVTVKAGNEAPVANAGPDQTVASEATVKLDGSGSTDPNNDPLSYEWSQLNGPAVTLEGASTAKPTFKAPWPATLEFELEVCDPAAALQHRHGQSHGRSSRRSNEAPVANAGPDQTSPPKRRWNPTAAARPTPTTTR